MKKGGKGSDIRELQKLLIAAGYSCGDAARTVTGHIGVRAEENLEGERGLIIS